jgi:DNA recombination protein RmuC
MGKIMNDLNLLIIIGIGILFLSIISITIYFIQKKIFEIIKYNINSSNNETELDFREKRISDLIEPLANQLKTLNNSVNDIEKNRIESYGRLSEQVDILANGTRQLEQALRSPTSRGKWGEVQLKRILELAGMSEHVDFILQKELSNSGGRPDAIIHLPGNRSLAIDAKTPLSSYIEYTEANSEEEKNEKLKKHANNIKNTAKLLGQKEYQNAIKGNLDFVIMFIPGDHFFTAATKFDPDIFENALKNKVLICTPATLIALLKGISFNWQQENLAKNVKEIALHSQELQIRILKFFEYMDGIKKGIETAGDNYDKVIGSIEKRIIPQIKKISELGAMEKINNENIPNKTKINLRNKLNKE